MFATIVDALRSGRFLDAERARVYAWMMFGITAAVVAVWVATARGGVDMTGKPLGTDFVSFYVASKIALAGAPAEVWSILRHGAEEQALFPSKDGYTAYFYPPVFLIVCLPFALLPYLGALAAWVVVTSAAAVAVTRRLAGGAVGVVAILGFNAFAINAGHGQNAALSTALYGAATLMLDRRPVLAGMALGCLAFKPHLAVVVPFALVAARRWTALVACGVTAAALVGISVALFGIEAWRGFLTTSAVARATLEQGLVEPAKMQSAFAAVRLLGGSLGLAYGVQAAVAAATLALLVRAAWRGGAARASGETLGAAMAAATLVASPFLLDYDLLIAAVPLVVLAKTGLARGFRPYEVTVLVAAYVLPLVSRSIATSLHVPLAPFVCAALAWMAIARLAVLDSIAMGGQATGAAPVRA